MRKLIFGFLFSLAFIPDSSFAASCANTNISNGWTCVISTSKGLGANGGSTTGVTTSTATLIIFAETEYAGTGGSPTTQCTPTDTINGSASGNTWTQINSVVDASLFVRETIWRVTGAPNVGVNHVVTCTNTGIFSAGALLAYKDTGAINTDNSNAATVNSSTTVQPGSVNPTANNPLLITDVGTATDMVNASSIDSSFTIVENVTDAAGTNVGLAVAHITQASHAAVNPTWTMSASNGVLSSVLAAFRGTSASSGGKGSLMLSGVGK